ncbi:hypothetical protein DM02DRAFT_647753 [Periconia macrospinosa]|uniref:Zn(2)-C6 fungal-type domain-containing protein n=1 Tax=Periconia macrospinosa TaxID=97972 RepID=A0A2V1EDG6_9PLEO|nr:hypothetical protein DM02DRAFT_647753 [Periconia macrospinosa]
MEFEAGHRYTQDPSLAYGQQYFYHDRNIPFAVGHHGRINPRGYPFGVPFASPSRVRPTMNRDEANNEGGPARRRVPVACARCRKRKIRCSGDPGDASACGNCKAAGIDPSQCQFHRVGSGEATKVIDKITYHNNAAVAMQMYEGGAESMYPRTPYPQLDTKSTYPSVWPASCAENTSPVDAYSLEPSAYLAGQQAMATYPSNYRWSQSSKASLGNSYLEPDPVSGFNTQNLSVSYMSTNVRNNAPPEAGSPLNMTSLQISLPERHTSDAAVPQRQLPIPQPSPAQTTRNIVDQMQDRRLRSVQGAPNPLSSSTGFSRLPILCDDVPSTAATESSAAAPVSSSCPTDPVISYVTAVSAEDIPATSVENQPQINFSTSTLLDGLPASAVPTTYSNFRNYNLPTSSPDDPHETRPSPPTNVYGYSPSCSRRRVGDSRNDEALYSPRNTRQPRHQHSLENVQRDSLNNRSVPVERATTNLNRIY